MICFSLSTIAYFEILLKKIHILVTHFKNESDSLIVFEFDELNDLNADEVTMLDETTRENVQMGEATNILSFDLESVKNLKHEIEHLDVNLGRYNVRNESDEFLKKIVDFDEDKENMTDTQNTQNTQQPKKPANNSNFRKDSKFKKIYHKNKRLCIFFVLFIICILIIGVVCAVVFGKKK